MRIYSFSPLGRITATFFLAMVVIGVGASPLHTLSPAYFDSVVKARHLPVYLGIFYACAALGPALRVEMLDLVQDLARETGAGLIMVTHAPDDVRRIADEVIFVEGGRAHAPGPAAELLDNPPPALRAYLG